MDSNQILQETNGALTPEELATLDDLYAQDQLPKVQAHLDYLVSRTRFFVLGGDLASAEVSLGEVKRARVSLQAVQAMKRPASSPVAAGAADSPSTPDVNG